MIARGNVSGFRVARCQRCCRAIHSSPSISRFRVLFFGRDEFSCSVLEQLHSARDVWQDIQVVTQPDTKTGRRGSYLSVSPLKRLAEQRDLAVHTIPHERSDFKTWTPPPPFAPMESSSAPSHHLLVTASFGRILSNALLGHFAHDRLLNVHPSLLPAYRGAAPIQHALMDGQRETGVSVISMTERKKGIDSGAVWGMRRMPIAEGTMFPGLRDSLAREGGELLVSVLRDMLSGKATSVPQSDDPSAPRAPLIGAADAMVDFTTMTADRVVGLYRAISHQKPITALLPTLKTLQLHSPTAISEPPPHLHLPVEGSAMWHKASGALIIKCARDTFLSVPQVRQQDRSLLPAKEWWNGVKPEMRMNPEGSADGPVLFLPPQAAVHG